MKFVLFLFFRWKWISDSCSTVFEIIDLLPLILLKSAQKLFLLLSTFQLQQHISKLWNFTYTQICRKKFFEGNMKRGDLKPCYLKSITTTGATASQQKKRRTTEGNWCDVRLCPSIMMVMVIMMMIIDNCDDDDESRAALDNGGS